MTLLAFNGFEGYVNPYDQKDATDFITSISRNAGMVNSTGRNGGKSLKFNNDSFSTCTVKFAFDPIDNSKKAIMGMAVKVADFPGTTTDDVIMFGNGINSWGGFVAELFSNGILKLKIMRYNTVIDSYDLQMKLDTWYYIEAKVNIHNTTGSVIIRLDEQEVASFSGDTDSGFVGTIVDTFWLGFPNNVFMEVDDIYIADDQGTENNDFLGDIRIDAIHPDGAGNYSQFTPSAGNNYECVDETEMDDTDYVSHLTSGEKDSYTYDAVPTDLDDAGIISLQTKNNAKRTAAASNIKIDNFIRTGSTDYSQTAQDLPDIIGMIDGDIIIEDPSDSNPWTQAKINACEFGMGVG
jgi:hypothetical protein